MEITCIAYYVTMMVPELFYSCTLGPPTIDYPWMAMDTLYSCTLGPATMDDPWMAMAFLTYFTPAPWTRAATVVAVNFAVGKFSRYSRMK